MESMIVLMHRMKQLHYVASVEVVVVKRMTESRLVSTIMMQNGMNGTRYTLHVELTVLSTGYAMVNAYKQKCPVVTSVTGRHVTIVMFSQTTD